MRITNPDWHPSAWSQLTAAQRRYLRVLHGCNGRRSHSAKREWSSFRSLIRHGLVRIAVLVEGGQFVSYYTLTDKGRQFLSQGGVS